MRTWSLLAGAITAEVVASLSLKAAQDRPALYGVVALGYLTAFVLMLLVLRAGMALGVAYGIWGASGVAATAVLSALLLDEPLTGVAVAGIGLVVLGVLAVELGAQRAAAARVADGRSAR